MEPQQWQETPSNMCMHEHLYQNNYVLYRSMQVRQDVGPFAGISFHQFICDFEINSEGNHNLLEDPAECLCA